MVARNLAFISSAIEIFETDVVPDRGGVAMAALPAGPSEGEACNIQYNDIVMVKSSERKRETQRAHPSGRWTTRHVGKLS